MPKQRQSFPRAERYIATPKELRKVKKRAKKLRDEWIALVEARRSRGLCVRCGATAVRRGVCLACEIILDSIPK